MSWMNRMPGHVIRALAAATALVAGVTLAHAEAVDVSGTVCRLSRHGDRLVVALDRGPRVPVAIPGTARVTFEGAWYEADDIRPGDKVQIFGDRRPKGHIEALRVDVQVRATDALLDALFRTKPRLVGRFAVREAATEFFSLNVPGMDYVRVDAKGAYGPKGRVWVSTLSSGDLLEIDGTWVDKDEIRASYIRILSTEEPGSCREKARRGETLEETAAREAAERRFLDGYDLPEEG
jgi:hypothetical protein